MVSGGTGGNRLDPRVSLTVASSGFCTVIVGQTDWAP